MVLCICDHHIDFVVEEIDGEKMLNFVQMSETLTGFLQDGSAFQNADVKEIISHLSEAGIDISSLEGLNPNEISQILSDVGIDLRNLNHEQITELFQHLNISHFDAQALFETIGVDDLSETLFKR